MKFDLGFGNSTCVRDAFIKHSAPVHIGDMALQEFDYPPYDGDPELVELTKQVIARQTGTWYDHVILTNGATGGVVIALRMLAQKWGYKYCVTRNPPFYLRYPMMIKAAGLEHKYESDALSYNNMYSAILTDIPSNPLALTNTFGDDMLAPRILDGVYYNRVYMSLSRTKYIHHGYMVGSYSKLLGLNGIRVGWIATHDKQMARLLLDLAKAEYCGISAASTSVLLQSLRGFNWDAFELSARANLNDNRTEWQKLERFFGDHQVNSNGMFYYAPIDDACKKLLEKANITWTLGSSLGTSDDYGRFNLGQSCDIIKGAVAKILQLDTIRK